MTARDLKQILDVKEVEKFLAVLDAMDPKETIHVGVGIVEKLSDNIFKLLPRREALRELLEELRNGARKPL